MADGREIVHEVMSEGDGPVIVHDVVGPWPLDLLGEEPMYDRFLRTLGRYGRLVVYDRPGLGSSDPLDPERDWLDQMCEASVAVLDAVGAGAGWDRRQLHPSDCDGECAYTQPGSSVRC